MATLKNIIGRIWSPFTKGGYKTIFVTPFEPPHYEYVTADERNVAYRVVMGIVLGIILAALQ